MEETMEEAVEVEFVELPKLAELVSEDPFSLNEEAEMPLGEGYIKPKGEKK